MKSRIYISRGVMTRVDDVLLKYVVLKEISLQAPYIDLGYYSRYIKSPNPEVVLAYNNVADGYQKIIKHLLRSIQGDGVIHLTNMKLYKSFIVFELN